ncbi:guanine nucleotide-binding protein subunit gamma 3 [Herrania umbratica]|uniref:Guanine nucleotide-binding protein subunit gamma 3 n=1 Tax=Herrania umbratica TaxID=108875 RepID=A0A6J1B6P4_9ROSI|nr:guanine nucleotide-binding protein subunit gamma 3 [Herrania umbratica]
MDGSSESRPEATAVSPRSPPGILDLYGKRTQMFKVHALEREIGLLQEELKSVEGLQPASRYCKEVDDFVGAKHDPLVTKTQNIHKAHHCWKNLWERSCSFSSVCCCFSCTFHLKMPSFSACCMSCKSESLQCSCLENTTCLKCYKCEGHSCSACACCCYGPFFHKFKMVNFCCGCTKACYSSCCQ